MNTALYPWQQGVWQQWQTVLASGTWPHAILLAAESGTGRGVLTRQLAQVLLCQNSETQACGLCHSCSLLKAGTHPDYHQVAPAEAGKQIGVDAVRQANRWAMETSQLGGCRVIEIQYANRLGEAAANAVLKTLEEPPAGCFYLLTTDSTDMLLPTIVSRCMVWRQPEVSAEVLEQWGYGQGLALHSDLARMYRHSPLKLLDDAGVSAETHQEVLRLVNQYLQPPYLGMTECVKALEKAGAEGLYWCHCLLMDVLKYQQGVGCDYWFHQEAQQTVVAVAQHVNNHVVIAQLTALQQLQSALSLHTGLNQSLMIAQWLTEFSKGDVSVS